MKKAELLAVMEKLYACDEATKWVESSSRLTCKEIWSECPSASWMLWLYQRADPDHKTAVRIACAIARTALVHVPKNEKRPERCIEVVEMWLEDRAMIDEVRNARLDAAAASDADAAAATAAASAASYTSDAAAAASAASYAADAASAASYTAAAAAAAATTDAATDAAADAARIKSQKQSANIVRKYIAWSDIEGGMK